jgi:hypothetical protein
MRACIVCKQFYATCGSGFCALGGRYPRSLISCATLISQHVYQFGCVREVLPVLDEVPFCRSGTALSQLLLGVHDDRTEPGQRLLNRFARHQEKANAFFDGFNSNLVAVIEEHE